MAFGLSRASLSSRSSMKISQYFAITCSVQWPFDSGVDSSTVVIAVGGADVEGEHPILVRLVCGGTPWPGGSPWPGLPPPGSPIAGPSGSPAANLTGLQVSHGPPVFPPVPDLDSGELRQTTGAIQHVLCLDGGFTTNDANANVLNWLHP